MNCRELWHEGPSLTAIRSAHHTQQVDRLLIKSKYSMISQGTEKLVRSNAVPTNLHEKMQIPHMQGAFNLPIHYGYSLVGTVVDGPDEWINKAVHVMHPHADYCQVDPGDAFIIEEKALQRQVLIANAETAINGIWDGDVRPGNRILVSGLGSVGFLVASFASRVPGVSVAFLETDPDRIEMGEALKWSAHEKGDTYDIIFHTTGTTAGLQQSIDAAGFEGTIVELSWYGDRNVDLKLGASFHSERKRLISSQVSHISRNVQGMWDFRRRKKLVSDLLATTELPAPALLSMDQAKQWFNGAFSANSPFILIDYSL